MRKAPLNARKIWKIFLQKSLPAIEILMIPFTWVYAYWFKTIRKQTISGKFRLTRGILQKVGVYPIMDHYYDPTFNYNKQIKNWETPRNITGFDLNLEAQLQLIQSFQFGEELLEIPVNRVYTNDYFYSNSSFEAGDAEFLYSLIRSKKPKIIIEIGSGNSTLIAQKAIQKNIAQNPEDITRQICIEPYPNYWLPEVKSIELIKERVECIPKETFLQLNENDILFIDSSHMVRPEGDVLFELMEILPLLKKGVFIHIHDIFTPYFFPKDWINKGDYFWNEQFILESILCNSDKYAVVGALYYLRMNKMEHISKAFPMLAKIKNNPGSFWIQKIKD
ncbi:MAG: class I SAM-dependent methyltransferase [Bacteroidetes bacterium]|nr:class I SAM-dependent methyltransferase [Bacteroidota bacterium]